MLNFKKPTSVLETVALGYLFIPIVVFMLSWIKVWISIPVAVLTAIALFKVLFGENSESNLKIKISYSFVIYSVICFALILSS